MRAVFAAFVLVALAACGQGNAPDRQGQARGSGPVVISSTRDLPDWLLVARQRDCPPGEDCPLGEVKFNQRTITRGDDGTADIWIQVRHGRPQVYQIEDATTQTTVRFSVQRLHYRFNCQTEQFFVVERQIMGAGETVVAREHPPQVYRAPVHGTATSLLLPIACRAG